MVHADVLETNFKMNKPALMMYPLLKHIFTIAQPQTMIPALPTFSLPPLNKNSILRNSFVQYVQNTQP